MALQWKNVMRLLTRATINKNKHTRWKQNATGIDVEEVQGISAIIFTRKKIGILSDTR